MFSIPRKDGRLGQDLRYKLEGNPLCLAQECISHARFSNRRTPCRVLYFGSQPFPHDFRTLTNPTIC